MLHPAHPRGDSGPDLGCSRGRRQGGGPGPTRASQLRHPSCANCPSRQQSEPVPWLQLRQKARYLLLHYWRTPPRGFLSRAAPAEAINSFPAAVGSLWAEESRTGKQVVLMGRTLSQPGWVTLDKQGIVSEPWKPLPPLSSAQEAVQAVRSLESWSKARVSADGHQQPFWHQGLGSGEVCAQPAHQRCSCRGPGRLGP